MKKMRKKATDFLEDRKVILKPIIKAGSMLGQGHDGEFMYTGTEVHFTLPYNLKKARLETILTREEQEFFEKELNEDLSIHKKKDNFWKNFYIKIRKDDKLMQFGYELDLSDPVDNLRYRVLMVVPDVAPSWKERFSRGEYKFALVDEDELISTKARQVDRKKDAYIFLGKIEDSPEKMINFLRVYGKKPSKTATVDFLKGEIDNLIEEPSTLNKVLSIIKDPNYEMKLFIENATDAGAIMVKGRKYYLQGGDPINENDPGLDGTVTQLLKYKRDTDEIYLRMIEQIRTSKK